jgi:hypothetical protein
MYEDARLRKAVLRLRKLILIAGNRSWRKRPPVGTFNDFPEKAIRPVGAVAVVPGYEIALRRT